MKNDTFTKGITKDEFPQNSETLIKYTASSGRQYGQLPSDECGQHTA